jgi:hypothetical protein
MTRWRQLHAGVRVGIVAVVVVVLLNVGLGLLDAATRGADQNGSRSSSFSTAVTGTAAYAELLERAGHRTSRVPGPLRPGALDPAATVIVLDADFPTRSEQRAIAEFVRSGGHLVSGGPNAKEWSGGNGFRGVSWQPGGPRVTRAEATGDLYTVRSDGDGHWRTGTGSALTVTRLSPGSVILLADASPLQNRRLVDAQNAAFGLALAGNDHRPVFFIEGPHGFDSASGFDAIPGRWKVALVGGALAALLTLIAASRRVGPAEETERKLAPARRAYVDALGASLARTRRPADAIAPLQAAAREMLARRGGLPSDAAPDLIRAEAAREGWSAEEINALFAPATDNETILAAGRALARAERRSP